MPRLIVCGKEGRPDRYFEAEGKVISIGRSSENHIPIDDLNSSRHHCQIHEQNGVYELIDNDSRNGLFVNGRRVTRQPLEPGDKVEIGTTVIYFDHVPDQALAAGGADEAAAGKATVDIRTGIFAIPDDPTGVSERIVRDTFDTTRIPRDEATRARREEEETTSTGGRVAALKGEVAEMRRLLQLNQALASELNLRRLLERVMDTVVEFSGAERGFLLLREERDGDLRVKVSRNIDRETVKDPRDKVSASIVREVVDKGQAILLTDATQDPRFSGRESVLNMRLRSVLGVPLRYRGRVLGAIYLDNRFASDRFDERTRDLLELVGDQASIAIENARLFEENSRQREELQRAKEELERLNQLLRERVEVQDRELVKAREALAARRDEVQLRFAYDAIITRSPRMLDVFLLLDKITDSAVPVLVQGESGTGKELVARALHQNGPRAGKKFVSENCAAIPASLMESEFFGHVKGAFTGAYTDKQGLFEVADGGTLFLDEIGDMDLDMQTKLLRVLQDGVLRRVGSKEFKRVDVRIISATNRDLLAMIKEGRFREDLYYRLNVINVTLPALRERKEDLPLLAEHFFAREARQSGRGRPPAISDQALDILMRYDWPGNVRELENEVLRAAALAQDVVKPEHLSPRLVDAAVTRRAPAPAEGRGGRRLDLQGRTLRELVAAEVDAIEEEVIASVLRSTGYKKSKSASILGVSRPTLDAKIEKFGLTREKVMADPPAEAAS